MSQAYSGGQQRWFFSTSTRLRYYYDPTLDQFVYENGMTVPRPHGVARDTLISPHFRPTPQPQVPPSDGTDITSPEQVRTSAVPRSVSHSIPSSLMYSGSAHYPADAQYYYGQERLGSSPTERSGSSISPQSPPSSPSSWRSPPTYSPQSVDSTQQEDDSSSSALARALAPLSVSSKQDGTAKQSNIHRWIQPTGQGNVVNVFDRSSQVMGTYQTEPKEAITDSQLFDQGVTAYRMLCETPNDEEKLYASFKRSKRPKKFFVVGKVFLILWVEPAGESNHSDATGVTAATSVEITKGRFGEAVFSKVRRFVVVREGDLHCTALPVMTYNGKGVSKKGVKKSDHAIIYTGRSAPSETSAEAPIRGEEGMRSEPIRIDVDKNEDRLDPMSRIDFGKPHTIHHNLKVRSFGKVNRDSVPYLTYQFDAVWTRSDETQLTNQNVQLNSYKLMDASKQRKGSLEDSWKASYDKLLSQGYSHRQAYEYLEQNRSKPNQDVAEDDGKPGDG